MTTIWKFPVNISDTLTIMMPKGARILTVDTQREQPCLWAVIDEDAPLVLREFVVRGTGHDLADIDDLAYVGTFQTQQGHLIWHLFERRIITLHDVDSGGSDDGDVKVGLTA